MIRPSSIYEDYLRQPAKPDVPATVLIVSPQGTVDVQLASGEVLRRVDLAGAASAGDRVMLRYDDHGNYTALGSRPASAVSGAAFVTATGSSGSGSGTIPDPHDLLGTHHTLPTVSAGQVFAAPASSSGTPSFRAISTTDLPTLTVSAGNGLTGGGALPSVTLNVGAGNGITVDASSVSVQRAATSGLSFSGTGLQIDDSIAGAGLTIAGKVLKLADGVAGAGLSINTSTKVLSVSAGDGISVASSPSAVAVDSSVARSSWKVNAGAGLAVTNSGNLSSSGPTFSVSLAATSGLNTTSGLAVGAGAGISVLTSTVAVDTGYAFTWSAAHTFSARPTFSLGATIAAGQTLRIGSGTGDVDLSRKASDVLALGSGDAMESTSYQSGVSGWRIGAAGSAEFGNVRIRGELASTVFRFNEVSATAGTLGVYYSASTVDADFTTPAATNSTVSAQIKNSTPTSTTAIFQSGDRLQVRVWNGTSLTTAWFTVDAAPTTATGYSTYSLRLQSGSTNALVPAGTAIVDWGTASGGGAVALSSDGTIGTAPNISVLTSAGSPWSDQTLRARLGNLNGSYGYAADTFGFAAGNSATTFLAVDSTNGFRVVRDTTTRFQVDTAGALTIRNTAGAAVITMDSTSARIDNVLNIGTSGEIRQGTGSLTASPATFTGTRIWNDSGVGRVAGYNSGTQQWYAGTDGKLYAGGGNVRLDSSGVSVLPTSATSANGAYVFRDVAGFTTNGFGMFGTSVTTGGNTYMSLDISNYGNAAFHGVNIQAGDITLTANSGTGINNGDIAFNGAFARFNTDVRIYAGLSVGLLSFDVPTGDIYASGNVHGQSADFNDSISAASASFTTSVTIGTSSGGLNVGTTGAGAGAIKAAAGISGTTGTFTGGLNVGSATGAGANEIKATTGTFSGNVSAVAGAFSGAVSGTTGTFSSSLSATAGAFTGNVSVTTASQPQVKISSTGTGGNSRVYFQMEAQRVGASPADSDFFHMQYAADSVPRQVFWTYNTTSGGTGGANIILTMTADKRVGVNTSAPGYPLDVAGDVNSTGVYRVSGTQVVGARKTGWAAATGTATRTTFATSTVTTAQLAERVKALIDDLTTHGLIGA